MRGLWPSPNEERGYAQYTWESRAFERMKQGQNYYRKQYSKDRTPDRADIHDTYPVAGMSGIARTPLQRGQGITFRTVTDQPRQASAWWYPARRVKVHARARKHIQLTHQAITMLRELGVL